MLEKGKSEFRMPLSRNYVQRCPPMLILGGRIRSTLEKNMGNLQMTPP